MQRQAARLQLALKRQRRQPQVPPQAQRARLDAPARADLGGQLQRRGRGFGGQRLDGAHAKAQ